MTRHAKSLRAIVIGGLLMALAACSSSSNSSLDGRTAATPGSEQDFIVNVGDRVFFPTDQTNLTDAGMDTLRRQAAWLKLYPQVKILMEGHADERGTREYNLALSARRSANSKTFLISQGVDPSRIRTISYGKERPVALCDAESCWSQNRRAVTVVTEGAAS
jgi:peptidoglycan-associated lipoprotein